jgi:nanoRNase/pAp phosphatase (c-di-AMP/oligoRNAs hydrolase)
MARISAESEVAGCLLTGTARKSERFLRGLESCRRVTFVSHVHPDPDSLGSMVGLAHLVETCLDKPTRLTRDGLINRAENRALVEALRLNLTPVDRITWSPGEAVVMVDSQPDTGRHHFPAKAPLYAVIDHHLTSGNVDNVPFTDIRRKLGSTCTLVTRYLFEQEVEIPKRVATALYYGIETEIAGFPREASPYDDSALQYLFPLADKDLLAVIRNARLPESYYECILQALQSTFIYDRLLISWVNDLQKPEHAAEVCDFLMRFDQVEWAMVGGVVDDKMVLSVRTTVPQAEAGEMLLDVVGKLGQAGGHDRRAGGCIRLSSTSTSAIEDLQSELRRRFLKALRIDDSTRGRRLVPKREMLQLLQ